MNEAQLARSCVKSDAVYKAAATLILPEHPTASVQAAEGLLDLPHVVRPPILKRGKGAAVIDVDGNEYIDYFGAAGTLILGRADQRVVVAVNKGVSKGCELSTPSETEVRLAELLVGRFASIEMVRFVSSRRDAIVEVSQLAKRYTGRKVILTLDSLEPQTAAGSGPADSIALDYNDGERVRVLFRERGSEIAAVLVEPIACNSGLELPEDGFLETLRACCDKFGALLIYEESIAGFRVAMGGAAELYGVSPDLTVFGATLGAGLPLVAYGGRAEFMRRVPMVGPASEVVPTKRPSVGLPAMAAGVAVSQATSEPGFYQELEARSAKLNEGLRAAASAADVPVLHAHVGSMVGMTFAQPAGHARSSARSNASDGATFVRYHQFMLDRGVFLPPSPSTCLYLSAAHTDEDIERTIDASHEALQVARVCV